MPKTLKVYAGSDLEDRCGETQFILRHLRKAVCWVASTQYNIHAFSQVCILDELTENALWFLSELARQVSIVMGLAGRRQANFIDILNAVYMTDRKLYREFLHNTVEYCAPQETDDEALNAYVSIRLGRPIVTIPPEIFDGDLTDGGGPEGLEGGSEKTQIPRNLNPSLIDLPPTFLELTMQRAIINVRNHLGSISQSVPSVAMSDLLNSQLFTVPTKPGAVTQLADVLAHRSTRADISAIENTLLAKFRHHIVRKEETMNFGAMKAGILKRPAGLASDQSTISAVLTTDSVPDTLPHKGLPIPWPSDLPDWAPLIPADTFKGAGRGTEFADAAADAEAMKDDPTLAATESAGLQLELCDIEPDYPAIETFEPSNPDS